VTHVTLMELQARELDEANTMLKGFPEKYGETMRFARKAMGLRREELGQILGLAVGAVERIEDHQWPSSNATKMAMRALVAHWPRGATPAPASCEWHGAFTGETTACCIHHAASRHDIATPKGAE
jgi:hypothetical protein